jgi:translation initiation factor IF-2
MAEIGKTQKIRLYHLAKELEIPTQDILSLCKEAGLDVKTHASTLDEEMAKKIKKVWLLLKSGKVEKIYRNTQEGAAEAVVSKPADAKAKTAVAHPAKTHAGQTCSSS